MSHCSPLWDVAAAQAAPGAVVAASVASVAADPAVVALAATGDVLVRRSYDFKRRMRLLAPASSCLSSPLFPFQN